MQREAERETGADAEIKTGKDRCRERERQREKDQGRPADQGRDRQIKFGLEEDRFELYIRKSKIVM